MRLEYRKTDQIRPYERNPRKNDNAVAGVARSIAEFGFRQPIVVDETGLIIVGHTRYKAALQLGLEEVPVHVATDLSPEQVKALRIADNKLGELASWDLDLLPGELAELKSLEADLQLLGFSETELARLLAEDLEDGDTDPDDVPPLPEKVITQPSDLWLLGQHRLLCGDAGSEADVARLCDGAPIHLVSIDPPYNVRLMYSVAA